MAYQGTGTVPIVSAHFRSHVQQLSHDILIQGLYKINHCKLIWELHSTYPTPCYKESSKIRVLPSGTLLQSLDLEIFCQGISILEACYQIS